MIQKRVIQERFATPSVWYEAHLRYPGFELYGHFQALNPMALLGHNQRFGWSLTMLLDNLGLIGDKERGLYFDPEKLHFLNHKGDHFKVRGPLTVMPSAQGRPVMVQEPGSFSRRLRARSVISVKSDAPF